jgi:hypothetical protein
MREREKKVKKCLLHHFSPLCAASSRQESWRHRLDSMIIKRAAAEIYYRQIYSRCAKKAKYTKDLKFAKSDS